MNLGWRPTQHLLPAGVKANMANPWVRSSLFTGGLTEACDVTSRMEIVREASVARLKTFIAWPGTQKTVRIVAEKRLKRLLTSK